MASGVKGSYLRILAVYAHIYAFLIAAAWLASLFGFFSFPLPIITVVLAVIPSAYYLFVYKILANQLGRYAAYTTGVIVLTTPMFVIFLTTSGYLSINNLALGVLVFLSAALGPGLPIALMWMLLVGYALAAGGYIPSLGDTRLGVLLLLLYAIAGILGWLVFRRYYIREDAEAEELRKTLRAEQLQSENVIAAISDGVAIVGNDGVTMHANQKFLDMIALKQEEIIGKHYSDIVSSRVRIVTSSSATPRIGQNIREVLKTGEPLTIDSITYEYIDGSGVFDASISISPLKNEDGELGAVMVMARDITSLMKLQRMKDALIATASHELRTPITVIAGYADLLLGAESDTLSKEQRHYIERSKETAGRLTEMVNDMLDMSQLESGQSDNKPVSTNILRLLESITEGQLSQFAAKNLTLHLDAKPIRVYADRNRLQQVVSHLLSNAFKFTPEGGKVIISVTSRDNMCEVQVTDTGPGVPEEHLTDIFDKFTKLDDTGSQPGAGIGLAIAKAIVDNWGGTIRAGNVPEGGARFSFTVPLAQEGHESQKEDNNEDSDH